MDAERCIVCGAVIPEGRQVCPTCIGMNHTECDPCAHEWVYDGLVRGIDGTWFDYKCQRCGAHRLGSVYGGMAVTYKEGKDDESV